MGPHSELDNRMDQRLRLDCPGRFRRATGQSIDCGCDIVDTSKLRPAKVASILDLHCLQRDCIPHQRFHDQPPATGNENGVHLVYYRICGHFDYRAGLLIPDIFFCGIRVHRIH